MCPQYKSRDIKFNTIHLRVGKIINYCVLFVFYFHPDPGGIPYDGVPDEEVVPISLGLAIVFFILATSGILFALGCIIFNFVYRESM